MSTDCRVVKPVQALLSGAVPVPYLSSVCINLHLCSIERRMTGENISRFGLSHIEIDSCSPPGIQKTFFPDELMVLFLKGA